MKTAIVTDSTSNLNKDIISKYNIKVIPVPFRIDNHEYLEGVNISNSEFYQKLKNSKAFPTTSQPPVGELLKLYNNLVHEGYDAIISIHISDTISGLIRTLSNLSLSKLSNVQFYPIDSSITEIPMGWMVIKAAKMAAQGIDPQKIVDAIEKLKKEYGAVFVVDDLKNLAHGGRLSNASAFMGTVLKIKPLLEFDRKSDKIVAFEKVRSMKRAMKRTIDIVEHQVNNLDYPYRFMVIHADAPQKAKLLMENLKHDFPNSPVTIHEFTPVVAIHLGHGALGIGWIRDINRD